LKGNKTKKSMEFIGDGIATIFGGVGLNTPLKRFLMTAVLGALAEFFFKPKWAFDDTGAMRKWAMPFADAEPGSTYTPIGFFPILGGLFSGLVL
jgi:hypothetical protein